MNAQTARTVTGTKAWNNRPRLWVLAEEEFRRAVESRWLFAFAALFALFVLGLSYFGLAQSREVGFQSFARVTLSLLNLVLFTVPLAGLLLGVSSLAGNEGLSLLLAQPVSRREVLLGKFLGLGGAFSAAQMLGFGGGGVVVAMSAGVEGVRGFAVLCALSLAIGWLTCATALFIAAVWPDRLRAMTGALGLWLLMVVAYDLAVLGATTILNGIPLQSVLLPALLLNPVDLARVLVTLAVGAGALFGPTSAVLVHTLGSTLGITVCVGVLVLETVVPLLGAIYVFERRDW